MILVTGCSGYIGQRLNQLLKDKFDLIGIDREESSYTHFLKCDLNDENLKKKLSLYLHKNKINITTIIHLAAARTDRVKNQAIYFDDNINATRNFLESIEKENIIKFINVSSVAAIDGEKLDPNLKNLSDDDLYRYTKYKQERLIKKWCTENNISLVNFMPSAIYSKTQPANTNTFKLAKIAKYSPIIFSAHVKKSLTELDNFIENISKYINTSKEGNILAIEKPIITIDGIINIILKKRKTPYIKIYLSKNYMIVIAKFWEFLFKYTKIDPFISVNRVKKFFNETEYKNICLDLDYDSVHNIEASIEKNMS